MANHKSAIKAAKSSQKARLRNMAVKSKCKTFIKKVEALVEKKSAKEAREALREAESVVMRAVSKKVINANRGSRIVSRLTRIVKAIEAPATKPAA